LRELVYRQKRFLVPEDVYVPSDDSFLLVDNLQVQRGDRVLDMGCGSGILGVFAGERASFVLSVDVSPKAIECARNNFILNEVSCKHEFRVGNLFTVVPERFDLILFNPPYLPISDEEKKTELIERAWDGGPDGRAVIDVFFKQVMKHLSRNGRILYLQSSLAKPELTWYKGKEIGLKWKILEKRSFFFEELMAVLFQRLDVS